MKTIKTCLLSLSALCMSLSAVAEDYYVKELVFPKDASIEERVDMASRLIPSDKQLAWQNLELTAFLHFGVNTFTNREWGDGTEDPNIFNPDSLDTDQWVKALKDAGFKMAILTAKHHDGFCLWPTATTDHSVASSSWLNGKGDVAKMLSESCRKYGLKLGLYLSPWDRNAACYGDSPRYNDMFVAQLTELLSNYGKVDEVWFDGACGEGPNGKKQVYDWQRFKETISRLQPEAVVAIMGDDVRWVGNERGMGRETEWSATALTPGILPGAKEKNEALGIGELGKDIGSRDLLPRIETLYWWPSEVDVSIRPGWFYHETEKPHSLNKLADIYINSVGRNSVLLLNIPPNDHGLISSSDVARLKELRRWIDDNFTNNIAEINGLSASLAAPANAIVLAEDISKGQRVEEFDIEALVDGKWTQVAKGTTVGKKRILMLSAPICDSLRVNVRQSRNTPNLSIEGVYNVTMPQWEKQAIGGGNASLPKNKWKVLSGGKAKAITDNDINTVWTSPKGTTELVIDMKQSAPITGFVYTPRQDGSNDGTIYKYAVYVSENNKDWTQCNVYGEFSNIAYNPMPQIVYFPEKVNARYIKLVSVENVVESDHISAADFDVFISQP